MWLNQRMGALLLVAMCVCVSCQPSETSNKKESASGTNDVSASVATLTGLVEWKDDDPVITLRQMNGFANDGPAEILALAVWKDGFVLYGPNLFKLENPMRVGMVKTESVQSALEAIEQAGFFSVEKSGFLVPHTAAFVVTVASSPTKQRALVWDENIYRGWESRRKPPPAFREFVAVWWPVRFALYDLLPTQSQPVKNVFGSSRVLRGFVFDEDGSIVGQKE